LVYKETVYDPKTDGPMAIVFLKDLRSVSPPWDMHAARHFRKKETKTTKICSHVPTYSKKGTFVNGRKVGTGNTVQLEHNDKISFLADISEKEGKGKLKCPGFMSELKNRWANDVASHSIQPTIHLHIRQARRRPGKGLVCTSQYAPLQQEKVY
jgi:hypothetical protein